MGRAERSFRQHAACGLPPLRFPPGDGDVGYVPPGCLLLVHLLVGSIASFPADLLSLTFGRSPAVRFKMDLVPCMSALVETRFDQPLMLDMYFERQEAGSQLCE